MFTQSNLLSRRAINAAPSCGPPQAPLSAYSGGVASYGATPQWVDPAQQQQTAYQRRTAAGSYEQFFMNRMMFDGEYRAEMRDSCPEASEADRKRKRAVQSAVAEEEKELAKAEAGAGAAATEAGEGGAVVKKAKVEEGGDLVERPRKDLSALLPGDEDRQGFEVYIEMDEKRGKPIARYEAIEATHKLHIKEAYDYQGRSFMHCPIRPQEKPCFIPSKCRHTFKGHTGPVSAIRWLPPHGHMLLSSSFDGKVKLWDVCNQRNVVQTYMGHFKGVKDICFNTDGTRFLSVGLDRFQRIWDTETGQCVSTYSTGKLGHVGKFHPDEAKQHIFLVGMNDNRVVQWDTRQNHITQCYDQHMGDVNTITFVDDGNKFITTGDDKTVRVWEFDVGFAIKYLADPTMFSMPAATSNPNEKFKDYVSFQSMTNEILTYKWDSSGDKGRLKAVKKKTFKGHITAAHACQIAFSTDSKWITSGDGSGNLWFWDWNSTRIQKKIKAHDGVCNGVLWHPAEPRWVATCGWDNMIRLWE